VSKQKNTKKVLLSDLTRLVARIGRECGIASVYVHNNDCLDEACKKALFTCLGNIKGAVLEAQHLMRVYPSVPVRSGQEHKQESKQKADHRSPAEQGKLQLVSPMKGVRR